MATRNMGLMDVPQIQNATDVGSYTTKRRVLGLWRYMGFTIVTYKMSGYNSNIAAREFWSSNDPNQGPPSGNVLTDVQIDGILVTGLPAGD